MVLVRFAIAGAGGRMGRALVVAAGASPGLQIGALLEHAGSALVGRDGAEIGKAASGVVIRSDVAAALGGCQVFIDFTRPEGALIHLAACRAAKVNMVIGTTGFDEAGMRAIADAGNDIAIVFEANMSIGVYFATELVERAARALHADYDIEVLEAHHNKKVDAPSGTALMLGEAAARGVGKPLNEVAVYDRHGVTGERTRGAIGFASLRAGDIVGDHTVFFAGTGERIEIRHVATSRSNFANGAMAAAKFLAEKHVGLFDMRDVLGLRG
ncbi:MAG: 4-hydroxy-tetrahydrodipicolinate reductase [Betaproteobacteria bacterium]|nr:4-hydroxy-tetrahydrodipicolinate reductase [Betaproteobacteria bacterium]